MKNVNWFFMYSARYFCQILMPLSLLDRFAKNTQTSNFMKILPVGAELFHAYGQTDMMKLTVSFRNPAKVSKKKERRRAIALNSVDSEIAFRRISKYVNAGP